MTRPYILTIAGFDPCGGAGILADIKTVERLGVNGLSACTALTVQNDDVLKKCQWSDPALILGQIGLLIESYPVRVVKIGIVESMDVLRKVMHTIRDKAPGIRIIWDPVLKSSSGYSFHGKLNTHQLYDLLNYCHVITPNYDELLALSGDAPVEDTITEIASRCYLLLKGGHRTDRKGTDILYRKGLPPVEFSPESILRTDRHGSGCVFSSAVAAFLARGYSLEDSCQRAKAYTYRFLQDASSEEKLGGVEFQYISRGKTPEEHLENIRNVCAAGGKWIQLRIKDRPERELFQTAEKALSICREYGAKLIIDDSAAVAKATGADGVHLGSNDLPPGEARDILGPGFIIGGTANSIADVESLARAGVDYIGLGPFRFTTTKKKLSPVLGLQGYSGIMKETKQKNIDVPVIAIGGIKREDIPSILETGIRGIAVSSLLSPPEKASEATTLRETISGIQEYFDKTPATVTTFPEPEKNNKNHV